MDYRSIIRELLSYKNEAECLEKVMENDIQIWQMFLNSQNNYSSLLKIDGRCLPPPVMTVEKRRKMNLYKKHACIVNVKNESKHMEKEFLSKVQSALDENFDIDMGSSVEDTCVISERKPPKSNKVLQKTRHDVISEASRSKPSKGPSEASQSMTSKSTTEAIRAQNIQSYRTVDNAALVTLLNSIDPIQDKPTHEWLVERAAESDRESRCDMSLERWFQNAPDSVKQKLISLLPPVKPQTTSPAASSLRAVEIHQSPVEACHSFDDTLRSASPLCDENKDVNLEKRKDGELSEPNFLVTAQASHNSTSRNLNISPIQVENILKETLSANIPFGATSAADRRRAVSMQSYTVEEPSLALLNSTLNNTNSHSYKPSHLTCKTNLSSAGHQTMIPKSGEEKENVGPSPNPPTSPSKPPSTAPSTSSLRPKPSTSPSKPPSMVPSTSTLRQNGDEDKNELSILKHNTVEQLLSDRYGLPNNDRSLERRALTPITDRVPCDRVMTPTPPARPKSEMSIRWSRSITRLLNEKRTEANNQALSDKHEDKGLLKSHNPEVSRSKSCKIPRPSSSPGAGSVRRAVTFTELQNQGNEPKPVTAYAKPVSVDRLQQARKQLQLLKSKLGSKVKNEENLLNNESKFTSTSITTEIESNNSILGKEAVSGHEALNKSSLEHDTQAKSRLNNNSLSCTTDAPAEQSEELIESVSQKSLMAGNQKYWLNRFAAIIKGRQTRRLFNCSKVKSLTKTIRDCDSLLDNLLFKRAEKLSSHDAEFKRRLCQQMTSAKTELHNIFFVSSTTQRFVLIKQSDKVLTRLKKRSVTLKSLSKTKAH